MRFKGETVHCESCNREIAEEDDMGWEDNPLCSGCSARAYQAFINTPCKICGKKMGKESNPFYDENQDWAHGNCVDKLSDEELEEQCWSDDWG